MLELVSGYFFGLISSAIIICGILTATIIEALPLDVNDNFSVALFPASLMYIAERFF